MILCSGLSKKPFSKHSRLLYNVFIYSLSFHVPSESKKTGWMTSTDATAAFTPLKWTVGEPKLVAMMQALEETLKERSSLSPLQKAQYEIQLDWLRKGETPQVLTVMASMGVINPEQGKSYFTMVSSVQVRHCHSSFIVQITSHICFSLQHPFSRGSVVCTAQTIKRKWHPDHLLSTLLRLTL